MGLKIGKFFRDVGDKINSPGVRNALGGVRKVADVVNNPITRKLVSAPLDIASDSKIPVISQLSRAAQGVARTATGITSLIARPSIGSTPLPGPNIPFITAPPSMAPAKVPAPSRIQPGTGVTQGIVSSRGVSGGISFGTQSIQPWLPFVAIAGVVLVLLASGGISFKSR